MVYAFVYLKIDGAGKVEEQHPSTAASAAAAVASTPESASNAENPTGSETKKKSTRCQTCRKKVGLTGKSYGNITVYLLQV